MDEIKVRELYFIFGWRKENKRVEIMDEDKNRIEEEMMNKTKLLKWPVELVDKLEL